MIKFSVYLLPVPWARPRVTTRGSFPRFFTAKNQREYETMFRDLAGKFAPDDPLDCPIKVELKFYKPKPKTADKKINYPHKKPDIDNLIKLTLDSMNGLFFLDDKLVCEITAGKYYDENARTEVLITELK